MIPTNSISTSIFDLFKVGPGPSSSHTIGPMKAAKDFLSRIRTLKIFPTSLKLKLHYMARLPQLVKVTEPIEQSSLAC